MNSIESALAVTSLPKVLETSHVVFVTDNLPREVYWITNVLLRPKVQGSVTEYKLSEAIRVSANEKFHLAQLIADRLPQMLSEPNDYSIFSLEPYQRLNYFFAATLFLQLLSSITPQTSNENESRSTNGAIVIASTEYLQILHTVSGPIMVYQCLDL